MNQQVTIKTNGLPEFKDELIKRVIKIFSWYRGNISSITTAIHSLITTLKKQ